MTQDGMQGGPAASENQRRFLRRSLWMLDDIVGILRLVPDGANKHYGLALISVILGRFDDAMYDLNKAVEASPNHESALWLLGELNFKLGRYDKAAELLERVIRLDPNNLTAVCWLTLSYHCLGKKGKAINKQSVLQEFAPDLLVTLSNKQ